MSSEAISTPEIVAAIVFALAVLHTFSTKWFARLAHVQPGQWVVVQVPEWKPINGNMPSKHAWAIARQGACDTGMSSTPEETIKALKQRQRIAR